MRVTPDAVAMAELADDAEAVADEEEALFAEVETLALDVLPEAEAPLLRRSDWSDGAVGSSALLWHAVRKHAAMATNATARSVAANL